MGPVQKLSPDQIRVHHASDVDPHGFLFEFEDDLYRGVRSESEKFYRNLVTNPVIVRAMNEGRLVRTSIAPFHIPDRDCPLVLAHSRVQTVSYCTEWCPSMHRDAGLLTLDLALELSEEDKQTVGRARRIQKFLSQPFFVAEVFTGKPGKYVKLEDTVRGFADLIDGKLDHIPEQAFYMVGGIDEVTASVEKTGAAA